MANRLRIEIWAGESMEWSLEGHGSSLEYDQASIKLRALFPEQEEIKLVLSKDEVRTVERAAAIEKIKELQGKDNLMLTDTGYNKMMIFIYS